MIVQTHRVLGEYLYEVTTRDVAKMGLLQRNRFVYGNVMPDIVTSYRKMSHYYESNKEYVFAMIRQLISYPLSRTEFSKKAGIVMHFLTDYTCIFHACGYLNKNESLASHMRYEASFHFYATSKLKQYPHVKLIIFHNVQEIEAHVEKLTQTLNVTNYVKSMEIDFYHMLQLTLSALHFILKERKKLNL
ncbi:MAG: zinc dependent phospholipase C family protein [Turicibacter sp.]